MVGDQPSATIRFEGMREFRKALRDMGDDLEEMKSAHKDAAEIVARRAAVISPQREGLLRDSVDSRGTKTKGYVRAGSGRLVPYAGPIHFGWSARNIRPQPFLYDAMDQRRGEVLERYTKQIDSIARTRGLK